MTVYSQPTASRENLSVLDFRKRKSEGKKFSVVTCYDAAFARLINATNIDMVLVGDSLGNVMLGYKDTIPVTLDDMIHHCASVARTLNKAFLAVDMPFLTYQISKEESLKNAGRLIQEGGAMAVKVEGGAEICEHVAAIVNAGIPVIGHLGLTPQSVHALGGYKVQGRSADARTKMLKDAKALEAAGAMALVLELVPASLAQEVTGAIGVPTIGIGAGKHCDAQVLVMHDLLGFDDNFSPKFLKKYADVGGMIRSALNQYDADVKSGEFPAPQHAFGD